ncbi:uncharacterized protein JCM6883_005907 [Sporobolomyces salmoneus]|uniref:uncharacterized protein n=1 Tax=Sporobolomyces salmoneus TaxID=183962 RepID=UPI00316B1BDD
MAKILMTVRATLIMVAEKGFISSAFWHLWIPTPKVLAEAVADENWHKRTEEARAQLGETSKFRPEPRAKPAASLGSHLVHLNTRQRAIYFG